MTMQRRTFLWTGAVALGTLPAGCRPWMKRVEKPEGPNDHQRATLAAMTETFIPSGDGSPGARESDALALLLDPAYPVSSYVSELVGDLDDWCYVRHFNAFVDLAPAMREQALEERMGMRGRLIASWYKPVYEGVLALAKLSFFGGLTHAIGTTFTEFPGASTGYATNSAAGVYRGDGAAVMVAGPGKVSSVRVTALGSPAAGATTAAAARGPVTLHLVGPDGRAHEIAVPPPAISSLWLDAHAVASAIGTTAAGTWKLQGGDIRAWWLSVRTDLDDDVGRGGGGGGG
ncbi:MAG TPA: hypothetical protein VM261_13025 [Kofleriaceae bacterium]|nr:hypothetical protein [Kofleriaceae bacterium]